MLDNSIRLEKIPRNDYMISCMTKSMIIYMIIMYDTMYATETTKGMTLCASSISGTYTEDIIAHTETLIANTT